MLRSRDGCRSRARVLLAQGLLATLSTVLTLGALELSLRIAQARRGGGKEQREKARYTEYDPLLGWRKTPGARVVYHRREYRVEVAINDKGLRDPPRPYHPSPGTCRILAVGDSFVEAYTVDLEDSVTRQLESRLRAAGCPADVVNGGTGGYATDQEFLFYKTEGVRYEPRIVLVFFYYNDVHYNNDDDYYGKSKPMFQMTASGIALNRYPVPAPVPPVAPSRPDIEPTERGSALFAWVRQRIETGAPHWHDAGARLGLWPRLRARHLKPELRVYIRAPDRSLEKAWQRTGSILRAFRADVEARGSHFLVVYVPSSMEVLEAPWRLAPIVYRIKPERWDRRRVIRRLRGLAEREGYPVLDLTEALARADRGILGQPYFRLDQHWNARGHAAAAREIARDVSERGWLEGCGG